MNNGKTKTHNLTGNELMKEGRNKWWKEREARLLNETKNTTRSERSKERFDE